MADITDPAIVNYSNNQDRRVADLLVGFLEWVKFQRTKYNDTVAPVIAANSYVAADRIIDGATVLNGQPDGRTPVVLGDMQTLDSRLGQLQGILEAPFAIDVVNKYATNPNWPLKD